MENETKSMNTKQLTQAVSLLLERDETRRAEQRRKARRRRRRRREDKEARAAKLTQSIEVIKWCIVGITTVIALSLIVLILVVMEVEREVERVKGEAEKIMVQVDEIKGEAEKIRDKIRHPLESLGGALGRKLEADIGGVLGGEK